MFKITNNNISITRGETATYDAVFKHSDGTPLILDKNLVSDDKDVYGLFSVKLSMYDEDAVFRVPMKLNSLATFDTNSQIIDITDTSGSFDTSNVPDTTIKFVDSKKYHSFLGDHNSFTTYKAVYFTDGGTFPFVCKKSNTLYYFKNTDGIIDKGIYKYTALGYFIKDTTMTSAIPYYFDYGERSAYATVWYFNNNTYISGYFNVDGKRTYKHYLFDDSAVTPFTEVTFPLYYNNTTLDTIVHKESIWDDGDYLYTTQQMASGEPVTFRFNTSTSRFEELSVDYYILHPSYVWKDNDGNVFYTTGNIYRKWNKTTHQWDAISSTIDKYNVSDINLPTLIKDKVYFSDKVLVSSSNGLVWETAEPNINKIGTVWNYGDDWMCTAATTHIVTGVDGSTTTDVYNRIAIDAVDKRQDKLYREIINEVPRYYKYVGNTAIITEDDFEEYEFRLVFPFPYNIMKSLQPKLYKYEIALVGGTPTSTISDQTAITTQLPLTVDFKQYLVEFKDFKVEGSLSE